MNDGSSASYSNITFTCIWGRSDSNHAFIWGGEERGARQGHGRFTLNATRETEGVDIEVYLASRV